MKCRIGWHKLGPALFSNTKSNFRENNIFLVFEIITRNPSKYTIDHPDIIVSIFMANSIGHLSLKCQTTVAGNRYKEIRKQVNLCVLAGMSSSHTMTIIVVQYMPSSFLNLQQELNGLEYQSPYKLDLNGSNK